jgi:hypothetical protein
MKSNLSRILPLSVIAVTLILTAPVFALDHETTLYNFAGSPDGRSPVSLIADASGSFYGVTT